MWAGVSVWMSADSLEGATAEEWATVRVGGSEPMSAETWEPVRVGGWVRA